jgi:hypothetical protein
MNRIRVITGWVACTLVAACNVIPYRGVIGAHAITGVVKDAETGAPISGVTVCARYSKLRLHYYVRGVQVTGESGGFLIEKNPEVVGLADGPDGLVPFLVFRHPDYLEQGLMLVQFDRDRNLEILLKRRPTGMSPDKYLTCSDSAIVPL